MNWSVWIRVFLLFQLNSIVMSNVPRAVIRHPLQFVVEDPTKEECTVELDGTPSDQAKFKRWSDETEYPPNNARNATLSKKKHSVAYARLPWDLRTYKFRLRVYNETKTHTEAFSEVIVEDRAHVGMHLLASSVVSHLLKMQYKYLALSHHYRRADNYHPNVAAYYRSLSSSRSDLLQEIMTYILAKQATIDAVSSCPTDFVKTMMEEGLVDKVDFTINVTEYMTSSFEIAMTEETTLGRNLATTANLAEQNNDYELSEFVAADLIPRVTKVTNQLANHLKTLLRRTENEANRPLVEFLFDKLFAKSN